jgi:hypothetical protein
VFVVDDILLFPVRGALFVFREIHNAARQEFASRGDAIRAELTDLYMMLETGRITEEEFDASERKLLDRLDEMEASGDAAEAGPEERN